VNLQTLAKVIAKKEAKKSQVTIGNIREILSIISEILFIEKDFDKKNQTYAALMENGRRRMKNKKEIK
jgi:hypothetical protein